MKPLFKTRFEIVPEGERTHAAVAEEAFSFIQEWIEQHEIDGDHPVPFRVNEIIRNRDRPYQIREVELPTGEFHKAVYWTHPDGESGSFRWTTTADLVFVNGILELQFVLGIEAECLSEVPSDVTVGRPRIIANILANPHWTCIVGATPVPLLPKKFTIHEVEEIVDEALFAEDRPISVVVFGEEQGKEPSPVSPKTLADRLAGLATVYFPRDTLAATTLNRFLGPELAIEAGMVRVYMPGLSRDDDPANHWAFFLETIERRGLTGQAFADMLMARLAERAVVAVTDSPLLALYRKKAHEFEKSRFEDLRRKAEAQGKAADELLDEYQLRVDSLEQENEGLYDRLATADEELTRLRRELDQAQRNIAELSRRLGRGTVEFAEPAPEPTKRRLVKDIVEDLSKEFENLEFLPSALKSAADVPSSYEFPERVQSILEELNKAADLRNANGGRMPRGWKEHFKKSGLKYKGKISETARSNWGDEYTFTYDGEHHLFQEHFTISAKDPNKCLSIHFSTRIRKDRIVVAWVGRHLTNTQT